MFESISSFVLLVTTQPISTQQMRFSQRVLNRSKRQRTIMLPVNPTFFAFTVSAKSSEISTIFRSTDAGALTQKLLRPPTSNTLLHISCGSLRGVPTRDMGFDTSTDRWWELHSTVAPRSSTKVRGGRASSSCLS
jgi:hypothetical protein